MSVFKLLLGFVVGVIACAILLALISIRSPILATSETLATDIVAEAEMDAKKNSEQTVNKSDEKTEETQVVEEAAPEEIIQEPVIDATTVDPEVPLLPEPADPIQPKPAAIPPSKPEITVPETPMPANNPEPVQEPEVVPTQPVTPEADAPQSDTAQQDVLQQVDPIVTPLRKNGNTLALGAGSSRLPSISANSEDPIAESGTDQAENAEASLDTGLETTEFGRNSNPLVDLEPALLSFILIDIGTQGVTQSELLQQTLPFAYAVEGARADAGRVAGDYRDAGFEVVSIFSQDDVDGLSDGAQAANLARGYLDAMPDALALMDAPGAKLQKDRRLIGPILEVLAISTHGLLSYKGGLSSVGSAAKSAGLTSGLVSRYLDAEGTDSAAIGRVIDRATLDANQDGAAIVVAAATAENVKAISEWAASTGASKVEIVPLSSAMIKQSR